MTGPDNVVVLPGATGPTVHRTKRAPRSRKPETLAERMIALGRHAKAMKARGGFAVIEGDPRTRAAEQDLLGRMRALSNHLEARNRRATFRAIEGGSR